MTQALHTPGPYEVRPSLFDNELLILADETCIASVPLWENDNDDLDLEAQSRANAALLAAAPDLLAALVLFLHHTGSIGGDYPKYLRFAVAKAREAIAKAKGGAA
jgi:hypothetical protein